MDAIYNLFKIKFDKMDELLGEDTNIKEDSIINIYFSLEPIWRLMLNVNNEKIMKTKTTNRILETTANIINIAGHYRLWCKKHKLQSRIILYTPSFDKIKYKNTVFNQSYRYHSLLKYNEDSNFFITQETIRESIQMTKTILEYVEGVYLIEGYDTEPSLIPFICKSKFNDTKNINFMISSDLYDFQYTNFDFYVFRPKKEESFLIRKGHLINTLKQLEDIKNNIVVSDELYSFVLSIIGDRNRNISKIKRLGVSSILTLLSKAKAVDLISDSTTNIELLIKAIKEEYRSDVLNNFYCIDLDFQYFSINQSSKLKIEYQIKDRFDNDSLIKLNNTYFNEFPIQLLELSPTISKSSNKNMDKKRNPFQER